MESLFPDVHLIQRGVDGRDLRVPLLVGSAGALLIDTGTREFAEEEILPALESVAGGADRLRWILNTHPDLEHTGGNGVLKRAAPRAVLACGTADRELTEDREKLIRDRYDPYRADHGVAYSDERLAHIRAAGGDAAPVDVTFSGGERIRLDPTWLLEVIHLPGHSRGHLAVLDHRHHVLFAGDALQGAARPGPGGEPGWPPVYFDVDLYLDSSRTALALARGGAVTTLVASHWPVLRGEEEIVAFCEEGRRFCMHTEQLVLAEVRRSENVRLAELIDRLGPLLGRWPRAEDTELRFALAGHLDLLERRGSVRSDRSREIKVYRA